MKHFCVLAFQAAGGGARLAKLADAGFTHVQVATNWTNAQASSGAALTGSEVTRVNGVLDLVHAAGLKAVIECAVQYPPAWARSAFIHFKDQFGVEWDKPDIADVGLNIRNWFWQGSARDAVGDFVAKCGAAYASHPAVAGARCGGGFYGETHFPRTSTGTLQYWAYDACMQAGTGIASGMQSATDVGLAGYVPFTGTTTQDAAWINWYQGGLTTFAKWLMQAHEDAGFADLASGKHVWLMFPGTGVRTRAWSDAGFRQAVGEGPDPRRLMGMLRTHRLWQPWNTWADGTWVPNGNDQTVPAVQKVLREARAAGKRLCFIENTGSSSSISECFTNGNNGAAYGLSWLGDSTLDDTKLAAFKAQVASSAAAAPASDTPAGSGWAH